MIKIDGIVIEMELKDAIAMTRINGTMEIETEHGYNCDD